MKPITMAGIKEASSMKPLVYGALFLAVVGLCLYFISSYEQAIFGWINANQAWMQALLADHPITGGVLFVLAFALVIGFYIPGGVVMLLLAGALFPTLQANILANIANLIGAVIGFLLARHLFYHEVQARYGRRLRLVNEGIRQHGWLYLFILRLAPIVPSPVVNLTMGLTPMRLWIYSLATLLGRIPMTALYVNLGAELTAVDTVSDVLSAEIVGTILLICLIMLAGNHYVRHRKV